MFSMVCCENLEVSLWEENELVDDMEENFNVFSVLDEDELFKPFEKSDIVNMGVDDVLDVFSDDDQIFLFRIKKHK